MNCQFAWILAVTVSLLAAPGCTGLFTKRAIEQFAESMKNQDLDKLKSTTSSDFEQKALRQKDAPKGLKMLKIPTGKVEIVSVEPDGEGKRIAIVKVGEKDKAKEVEYRLKQDKGHWVVDDVILKQDSGGGQLVERSITEQMDLLLTCRELMIAWREGSREEKLGFCDQSLTDQLQPLPPAWFEKLSKEIAGPGHQSTFKPDARLNGNKAFVVVPHPQGSLFLELHQNDSAWKLHDLAIEPNSKESTGIRALSKVVSALNQSAVFLNAYGTEDRDMLGKSSTKNFHSQCLAAADLKKISLPVQVLLSDSYEARQFTDGSETIKRVELLLHDQDKTFMLTLREEEPVKEDGTKGIAELRVDEVTMFEKGDKDVRRMSSVFLSLAVSNLYVDALRLRDLKKLKEMSSSDFNDRVWNRPEAVNFPIMPDPDLPEGEVSILATVFRGDTSEVTLLQGETPMTLVLRQTRGWMVVDDVIMPAIERPTSLKANLEVMFTVQAFTTAMHMKDLPGLARQSAEGLDRIAWLQLTETPALLDQFEGPMISSIVSIQMQGEAGLVKTTDGAVQAEIKLIKEGDRYVVEDVCLTTPAAPDQRMELMGTLRTMIAQGSIGPAAQRRAAQQQAAAELAPQPEEKKARFEAIEPAVYTR